MTPIATYHWLRLLRCVILVGAASGGPSLASAQSAVRPLKIEDAVGAIALQVHGGLGALSPDGQLVAYSACDPRRVAGDTTERKAGSRHSAVQSLGCDIYVTSLRGKTTRKLGSGTGGSWGPAWSRNSQLLAFFSDRDGVARVWLWDRVQGSVRRVSDATVQSPSGSDVPRWTPDGAHLVVRLVPEGMTEEQLEEAQAGAGTVDKAPGSTLVLYRSVPPERDSTSTQNKLSGRDPRYLFFLGDLALMDVTTGSVRRLVRQVPVVWTSLSPDGGRAAYVEVVGHTLRGGARNVANLMVVDLAEGPPRPLVTGIEVTNMGGTVTWSPDGRYLAYPNRAGIDSILTSTRITSPDRAIFGALDSDLYVVAADGGAPRRLTGAPRGAIQSNLMGPLWDASSTQLVAFGDGKLWRGDVTTGTMTPVPLTLRVEYLVPSTRDRTYWSPDGGTSVYALTADRETLRNGFVKIDLKTGHTQILLEGVRWSPPEASLVSADGRTVLYSMESASESPDLWAAGVDFKAPRRITALNPQLDAYTFGTSRLVEYRSHDGKPLRGALLLPAGYQRGRRYPLVVWVYASGEGSRDIKRFGLVGINAFNMHTLTTRGYAVLSPDIPVQVGTPMRDLMKSVMPAIDKVVELGIADPNRLAVMGHSHGGYSTLALLVQTTRFKAGVMSAGFGDLTGTYGAMDPRDGSGVWHPVLELGGGAMRLPPWEVPQRYVENSPIYYLDRITTPLIIEAGSADAHIVPFSDQVFVGLKRLRKDVTYLRYRGEGHVLAEYPNLVDYWSRVTTFLDKHVKGDSTGVAAQ